MRAKEWNTQGKHKKRKVPAHQEEHKNGRVGGKTAHVTESETQC